MQIQPGDVPATHADITSLENYIHYKQKTTIEKGVNSFFIWFNCYYSK